MPRNPEETHRTAGLSSTRTWPRRLLATAAAASIGAGLLTLAAPANASKHSATAAAPTPAPLAPGLQPARYFYATYSENPATWTDAVNIARLDVIAYTGDLKRTPIPPWTSDAQKTLDGGIHAYSCDTGARLATSYASSLNLRKTINKKTGVGSIYGLSMKTNPELLQVAQRNDVRLEAYLMVPRTAQFSSYLSIAHRPCPTNDEPAAQATTDSLGFTRNTVFRALIHDADPATWTTAVRISKLEMLAETTHLDRKPVPAWNSTGPVKIQISTFAYSCATGERLAKQESDWVQPKQTRNAKSKRLVMTNINIPLNIPEDVKQKMAETTYSVHLLATIADTTGTITTASVGSKPCQL